MVTLAFALYDVGNKENNDKLRNSRLYCVFRKEIRSLQEFLTDPLQGREGWWRRLISSSSVCVGEDGRARNCRYFGMSSCALALSS